MAVYKATYCYPFLNAMDIRVGIKSSLTTPTQYLKCKVDTSNKDVTGYKIRILDADNNVIFDPEKISPISELQLPELWEVRGTNSGINGTYLQIPFFQNYKAQKLLSYNAVYYKPNFLVDRVILDNNLANGRVLSEMSNIDNWELDSEEGYLKFKWTGTGLQAIAEQQKNQISLDGELITIGDCILVASADPANQNKTGLWRVVKRSVNEGNIINETVLMPLNHINNTNKLQNQDQVTVLKGKTYHNTTWQVIGEGASLKYTESTDADLWCDFQGHALPDFGVDGYTLKWEITLYQGNGEISSSVPLSIDYTNIDHEWLDMTLTSGKILGSTPVRVQIASDDNIAYIKNGDEGPEIYLPEGQDGTLILQTRYMDMMNLYDVESGSFKKPDIFNGNRVYVQTYDSVYGHVYPLADSLENTVLQSSTHVQFFKHSNNPESILNGDIVDFVQESNIDFKFFNSSEYKTVDDWKMFKEYTNENTWMKETSVTSRLIVIDYYSIEGQKPSNLPLGIEPGDTILLTGQTDSKQNGVYEYYVLSNGVDDTDTDPEGNPVAVKDVTYYHCLKRAATYTTWAPYIGKVIYVSSVKRNYESLANAGTMNLWNPLSSNSGSSKLFFTNEMPILLFPQQFGKNCTYHLLDADKSFPETTTNISGVIDDQNPQVGNIILYGADGRAAQVTEVKPDGTYSIEAYPIADVGGNTLVYILDGKKYGHRMFRFGDFENPDWSCYTAKILKNSEYFTYVSPFAGIQEGMKLKFNNNKQVSLNGQSGLTGWLTVKTYSNNDQKLYRIRHEVISSNSHGIEDKNNGTYGLVSWSSFNEDGAPWKYEFRTFFRSSDENPFYAYESPYIILYKQGEQFSELSMFGINATYTVTNPITTDFDEYLISKIAYNETSGSEQYIVAVFTDANLITGRSVTLSGKYSQFQQASWESYRWVLLDSTGKQLQDTGKRYDKDMQVTFYGLANDTDSFNVYYAVLYVEDELQNVLQYTIRLEVSNSTSDTLAVPFTAEFDCKTHSVILSYQDSGILSPGINIGDNIQIYNQDSEYPARDLWDAGIFYNQDNQTMEIQDIGNTTQPIIDYRKGSTITTILDGQNTDWEPYNVSNSINYGVVYSNFFSRQNLYTSSEDNSQLTLMSQDSDIDENGEFYFDTEVKMGNNFCGEILEVNVEGHEDFDHKDVQNPISNLGEEERLPGYLTFNISLPDNFITPVSNSLNPNRNHLQLNIIKNKNSISTQYPFITKSYLINELSVWDIQNSSKLYHYIQAKEHECTPDDEHLHLSFSNGAREMWYFKRNNQYLSCKDKFLGNLNLISAESIGSRFNTEYLSDSEGAPSYWAENRAYLYRDELAEEDSEFFNGDIWHYTDSQRSSNPHVEEGYQKWPAGSEESDSYWNEHYTNTSPESNNNLGSLYPEKWEEVDDNTSKIKTLKAYDRHYNIENTVTGNPNWFRITMWIENVQGIYDNLDNIIFERIESESDEKTVMIAIKNSGQEGIYGKIRIIQKAIEINTTIN